MKWLLFSILLLACSAEVPSPVPIEPDASDDLPIGCASLDAACDGGAE